MDELRCAALHRVDVEESEAVGLFIYHVVVREVDKQVVVGLAPLQERLASLYVLRECRHVAPLAVGRGHVDRCVEAPSWPLGFAWRIARAVEEHMVHSRDEQQVEVGLALRERGAEMLCEPCERFGRSELLARYVRS